MSLIERIAGIGDPESVQKISVEPFHAAMFEMAQGQLTKANVVAYFELDATESDELQWIINQYNAQPTAAAKQAYITLLRIVFILAEEQAPGYTTNAQLTARLTTP